MPNDASSSQQALPQPQDDKLRREQVAQIARPLQELADPLAIPTLARPFAATVRTPGSKSLTNRALLLAALAEGESTLSGALVDADDAEVMLRALRSLGADVLVEGASQGSPGSSANVLIRVRGVGGRWRVASSPIELALNNAGTATRFLTAAALLAPPGSGGVVIDGSPRMRERPIRELGDALSQLGANLRYLNAEGYPPLHVFPFEGHSTHARQVEFGATASSQFISAVLMVAPFLPGGLTVTSRETLTSPSYISMTLALMKRVGVTFGTTEPREGETLRVEVPPQRLRAFSIDIEPDASGATYFEAAAALIPGASCEICGLDVSPTPGRSSLQGDAMFISLLSAMGAKVERVSGGVRITGSRTLIPVDFDLSDMPDTAMTAAVLACFASPTAQNSTGTSTLHGLRTLRVKETDRLAALQRELSKVGAGVEIIRETWHGVPDEALRISPMSGSETPVSFDTYDDHRMAMAFSLIGLRRPNVWIRDPACVRKTYANYFRELANLYT